MQTMSGLAMSGAGAARGGLFAGLFARPIATTITAPAGRYDAERQLYLDVAGDPSKTSNPTYCQVSKNVDSCGKGCDDEIHYETCD